MSNKIAVGFYSRHADPQDAIQVGQFMDYLLWHDLPFFLAAGRETLQAIKDHHPSTLRAYQAKPWASIVVATKEPLDLPHLPDDHRQDYINYFVADQLNGALHLAHYDFGSNPQTYFPMESMLSNNAVNRLQYAGFQGRIKFVIASSEQFPHNHARGQIYYSQHRERHAGDILWLPRSNPINWADHQYHDGEALAHELNNWANDHDHRMLLLMDIDSMMGRGCEPQYEKAWYLGQTLQRIAHFCNPEDLADDYAHPNHIGEILPHHDAIRTWIDGSGTADGMKQNRLGQLADLVEHFNNHRRRGLSWEAHRGIRDDINRILGCEMVHPEVGPQFEWFKSFSAEIKSALNNAGPKY